jgi:hypothetical protein
MDNGKRMCYTCTLSKTQFVEVSNMRTIISIVIIIVAAVIGFAMGAGMNEAMGGATLFATIAGFACTIQAIESKKKQ